MARSCQPFQFPVAIDTLLAEQPDLVVVVTEDEARGSQLHSQYLPQSLGTRGYTKIVASELVDVGELSSGQTSFWKRLILAAPKGVLRLSVYARRELAITAGRPLTFKEVTGPDRSSVVGQRYLGALMVAVNHPQYGPIDIIAVSLGIRLLPTTYSAQAIKEAVVEQSSRFLERVVRQGHSPATIMCGDFGTTLPTPGTEMPNVEDDYLASLLPVTQSGAPLVENDHSWQPDWRLNLNRALTPSERDYNNDSQVYSRGWHQRVVTNLAVSAYDSTRNETVVKSDHDMVYALLTLS